MFIAALFVIARTWKQPRCPSADEWTRKLWYIYTMEYYSMLIFYAETLLSSFLDLIVLGWRPYSFLYKVPRDVGVLIYVCGLGKVFKREGNRRSEGKP